MKINLIHKHDTNYLLNRVMQYNDTLLYKLKCNKAKIK